LPPLEQTHTAYLRTVDDALARLATVDQDLRALLDLGPLRPRVQRLRCFRGIDDLTALTIAAEFGDPRRFPTAPSTMAYVALVPSEQSSGTKRARGAITKTGNAHLRRVLVEAAWHYRHKPVVGAAIRRRQRGAPAAAIAHAWTAQQRLYHRYHRLVARGKPSQSVNTALARELTGFVWAGLTPRTNHDALYVPFVSRFWEGTKAGDRPTSCVKETLVLLSGRIDCPFPDYQEQIPQYSRIGP
jgi:hypothetical protein